MKMFKSFENFHQIISITAQKLTTNSLRSLLDFLSIANNIPSKVSRDPTRLFKLTMNNFDLVLFAAMLTAATCNPLLNVGSLSGPAGILGLPQPNGGASDVAIKEIVTYDSGALGVKDNISVVGIERNGRINYGSGDPFVEYDLLAGKLENGGIAYDSNDGLQMKNNLQLLGRQSNDAMTVKDDGVHMVHLSRTGDGDEQMGVLNVVKNDDAVGPTGILSASQDGREIYVAGTDQVQRDNGIVVKHPVYIS